MRTEEENINKMGVEARMQFEQKIGQIMDYVRDGEDNQQFSVWVDQMPDSKRATYLAILDSYKSLRAKHKRILDDVEFGNYTAKWVGYIVELKEKGELSEFARPFMKRSLDDGPRVYFDETPKPDRFENMFDDVTEEVTESENDDLDELGEFGQEMMQMAMEKTFQYGQDDYMKAYSLLRKRFGKLGYESIVISCKKMKRRILSWEDLAVGWLVFVDCVRNNEAGGVPNSRFTKIRLEDIKPWKEEHATIFKSAFTSAKMVEKTRGANKFKNQSEAYELLIEW